MVRYAYAYFIKTKQYYHPPHEFEVSKFDLVNFEVSHHPPNPNFQVSVATKLSPSKEFDEAFHPSAEGLTAEDSFEEDE